MRNFFVEEKIEKTTYIIEMIIAVLLAIGIIIGLIDLVKYFGEILTSDPAESYDLFQKFLGYALILVVGVELILMILYHSTKSILELVLFVIARKMLIYAQTMTDLVYGTLAIAMVFATLRFLVRDDKDDIVSRSSNIYSASTKVKDILKRTGYDIPTDKGETLGGLVFNLADEEGRPIEEGAVFKSGGYRLTITKATEDGLIEKVMITYDDKDIDTDINTNNNGNPLEKLKTYMNNREA